MMPRQKNIKLQRNLLETKKHSATTPSLQRHVSEWTNSNVATQRSDLLKLILLFGIQMKLVFSKTFQE